MQNNLLRCGGAFVRMTGENWSALQRGGCGIRLFEKHEGGNGAIDRTR